MEIFLPDFVFFRFFSASRVKKTYSPSAKTLLPLDKRRGLRYDSLANKSDKAQDGASLAERNAQSYAHYRSAGKKQ
jgi:hypothetical protein